MSGIVIREHVKITPEEQKDALLKAMIVAPVRALGLLKRVPELATKRGWPADGDKGYAFVIVAIGAYKLGLYGQRFKLPEALLTHERWQAFAAQYGHSPTCAEIVEAMDLDEMLEPV